MTTDAPVDYRCAAPAHRRPRPGADHHLTLHERRWAFCAYDTKADGHQWEATNGMTLDALERAAGITAIGAHRT